MIETSFDTTTRHFDPDYYNKRGSVFNLRNGISSFHLKTEILSCDACGVLDSDYPLTLSNMNRSLLMIIGNTPDEVSFDTEYGKIIANALKAYGFNFDQVYRTSLIKNEKTNKICHKHIAAEMILVRPFIAIALGYAPGFEFMENLQSAGQGITLSNGVDFLVTHSIKDIATSHQCLKEFYQHMDIVYNQYQSRLH